MRLIHTVLLFIEEFLDDPEELKYAVLSHRWGKQEVSYTKFVDARNEPVYSEGMEKISRCCQLASSRGIEWLWVDTCCIDKTNSAELSEAINSMWRWYGLAAECYVYLQDVPSVTLVEPQTGPARWRSGTMLQQSYITFQNSSWFTRGWTLQELLAPRNVIFCDSQWRVFGTKQDLSPELSWITGIRQRYLHGSDSVQSASVAMRMSWASKRRTTKKEDLAYCLLGIFDVNMPMLYGEGKKAFMRLQLEIIKKSSDESIFAWHDENIVTAGMLASSPSDFSQSGHVVHFSSGQQQRLPYSMTNQGLELRLPSTRNGPLPRAGLQQILEYQRLGFQMPNTSGDFASRVKVFQLSCGSSEGAPTGSSSEQILHHARGNVIFVTLALVDDKWQRAGCNIMDIRHGFVERNMNPQQMTYSMYYVPQQGL